MREYPWVSEMLFKQGKHIKSYQEPNMHSDDIKTILKMEISNLTILSYELFMQIYIEKG